MRRRLAAGNWKMNGLGTALGEAEVLAARHAEPGVDIALCPPATLIERLHARLRGTPVAVGGQNCHAETSGAHTGEISALMLLDAGATYVILGHSERRADHHETDAEVRAKVETARDAGLTAIICVGETLEERDSGRALEVIGRQLQESLPGGITGDSAVIAYEPVWAIGTGRVAEAAQIEEVHRFIRARLTDRYGDLGAEMRILYGGSVKAANAAEIFAVPDVDGALVGGASLKADDFSPIIGALEAVAD